MTPERIYMTGFMGSGKSTIGPRVANILGYDSMDLDRVIEGDLGMSIPAIFDVLGEEAFREAENEHLRKAGSNDRVVISLGGGTLMQRRNLEFCLESGHLVTLDVHSDVLAERLEHSPNPRPLLSGQDGNILAGEALRNRIRSLLDERRPVYERAHHVLSIGDERPDVVADRVVRALRAGLPE